MQRERESRRTSGSESDSNSSSRVYDRSERVLLSGGHNRCSVRLEERKLIPLKEIAEVRFGIKTGANEFFYVEDVTEKVEDE